MLGSQLWRKGWGAGPTNFMNNAIFPYIKWIDIWISICDRFVGDGLVRRTRRFECEGSRRNSSSFCAPFQLRRSGAVRFGPRFESLRETVMEHDRCITLLTICRAGSAPTVWSHEESVWEPVGQPVHLSSSSHFLLFLSLDVSQVSE